MIFCCNVGDENSEGKDPFRKFQPWEAAVHKWSYPDEVWDASEASEALDLVRKHFEDREAEGVPRYIGGDWRMGGRRILEGVLTRSLWILLIT